MFKNAQSDKARESVFLFGGRNENGNSEDVQQKKTCSFRFGTHKIEELVQEERTQVRKKIYEAAA